FSFRGVMQPIQVSGIEPEAEGDVSIVGSKMVAGRLEDLEPGEDGVIVGLMTARRFGLKLGDKLTLIVPEARDPPSGITPRMQRLNLVGVFKVGAELDGSLAMMHRADAAQMLRWQPEQVEGVRVRLSDLYRAPEIASGIAAQLGEAFHAEDWSR